MGKFPLCGFCVLMTRWLRMAQLLGNRCASCLPGIAGHLRKPWGLFSLPGSSRFVLNESPTRPSPSSSQGGSAEGTVAAGGQGLPQPPPGMSVYAAKRVIGESQWSAEQLEQVKWVKLEDHLLSSDLFYFFFMVFVLSEKWLAQYRRSLSEFTDPFRIKQVPKNKSLS